MSVPLPPTGFHVTREYYNITETTVTLDWDPPQGRGPETIVDNYTISISPAPPYQPARITVPMSPLNVTLNGNIAYSINLTAVNCVGESDPSLLADIQFSKYSQVNHNTR